jgi:hypothetical protein
MRRFPRLLAMACILGLGCGIAAPAFADVVHLVDGRSIEGRVVSVADGIVTIEGRFGNMTLKATDVVSIERGETEWEQAERIAREQFETLAPGTAPDAILEGARRCRDADLLELEDELIKRILARRPDHAATRKFMGQVRHDGRWVEQAVMLRETGKLGNGEWLTATEAEARAANADERKAARRLRWVERRLKRDFERLYSKSQKTADRAFNGLLTIAVDDNLSEVEAYARAVMAQTNKLRKLHRESSYTGIDLRATLISDGNIRTVNVNLGTIGRAAINVPIELPGGRVTGVSTSAAAPSGN